MITREYVESKVNRMKKQINRAITNQKYDDALLLISICASILYQTNIYYTDTVLEDYIYSISKKLLLDIPSDYRNMASDNVVLFFDGFGLNSRGLCQIYLKALSKIKKVIYITYEDRKELLPDVLSIVRNNKGEARFIKYSPKNFSESIKALSEIIGEYMPKHFFFYSTPDDVIGTSIMNAYADKLVRYQINLTDHAFWLGAKAIDKCIEFRSYGVNISRDNRGIDDKKLFLLPYYPIINKNQEFLGFPFEVKDKNKVIFSGGALYKTLGKNNKYYLMVSKILEQHPEVIFWYAGSGDDSEMQKLITKYPGRVFLTAERSDLFQILEHCYLYLSTYPMPGGLMFQYAAIAGVVPVTLRDGNICDDILLNQSMLRVEYDNINDLLDEVNKLISNSEYYQKRSEQMQKAVISELEFENEIKNILLGDCSTQFEVKIKREETSEFQLWYLTRLTKADIHAMMLKKNGIRQGLIYYPFDFFRGGVHIIKKKLIR